MITYYKRKGQFLRGFIIGEDKHQYKIKDKKSGSEYWVFKEHVWIVEGDIYEQFKFVDRSESGGHD